MRKTLSLSCALALLSLTLGACTPTASASSVPGSMSQTPDPSSSSPSDSAIAVTITASATTVEVDHTLVLTVQLTNDNTREGVVWSSSATGVATVDQNGSVRGIAAGTAVISATSVADSQAFDAVTITVTPSTQPSVAIAVSGTVIDEGQNLQLAATVNNPTQADVSYAWTITYGTGTLQNSSTANPTFVPVHAGNEKINLEVSVGQIVLKTSTLVYVRPNVASYTAISSAAELQSLILDVNADITGKFVLTADIDLGGAVITHDAMAGQNFKGTLDGNGHTISDFSIASAAPDRSNGAMLRRLSGTVRRLGLVGTIGEAGAGWGTSLLSANFDDGALVEDCFFDQTAGFDNSALMDANGWFPFNGVISGVLGGTIINAVATVSGPGTPTTYVDGPYPVGGAGTAQVAKIRGLYTDSTVVGGQIWDWGAPIQDTTGYHSGLVWSSVKARDFDLNAAVWTVADGTMPLLKAGA